MQSIAESQELRDQSPERPRAPTILKTKFTVWPCSPLSTLSSQLNFSG